MSRKLILLAILAVVGTAELLVMVVFYYLGIRAGWLESLVDTAVLVAISAPLLHRVLLRSERAVREGKELARAYQSLKGLYNLADVLKEATNERDVLNNTLQQVMKFPGIQAGWISLREGDTGFRLAAADGLPPALEVPRAFEGECLCRRKLLAGELDRTTNILECERLRQAKGDTRGLRMHASIPLWIGNRMIGVMNLSGPGQGFVGDKDLEILYSVGNQVAVALERTHLLHRMEKLVEERTAALTAEIAERQQTEEKLRQSEEQFRLLFSHSPFLMWVLDLETLRFLEANDSAIAHYGYSREEFLTMGIDNIRIPEQATSLSEIIEQIRTDGKSHTHCMQSLKKGEIIEVEIYWQALEFGGRHAVLGVVQDITDRRRAEEEKARLLSILEGDDRPRWDRGSPPESDLSEQRWPKDAGGGPRRGSIRPVDRTILHRVGQSTRHGGRDSRSYPRRRVEGRDRILDPHWPRDSHVSGNPRAQSARWNRPVFLHHRARHHGAQEI